MHVIYFSITNLDLLFRFVVSGRVTSSLKLGFFFLGRVATESFMRVDGKEERRVATESSICVHREEVWRIGMRRRAMDSEKTSSWKGR